LLACRILPLPSSSFGRPGQVFYPPSPSPPLLSIAFEASLPSRRSVSAAAPCLCWLSPGRGFWLSVTRGFLPGAPRFPFPDLPGSWLGGPAFPARRGFARLLDFRDRVGESSLPSAWLPLTSPETAAFEPP